MGCSAESCLVARDLLPWVAVTGFLTMALVATCMFGPVMASAAEGFWIMDGNVDRRRVLAGCPVTPVIVALVPGAGLGILMAALIGSGATRIITWRMASDLGCFGPVAFAAVEQDAEQCWIITALLWLVGITASAILLVLVAISARMAPIGFMTVLSVDST